MSYVCVYDGHNRHGEWIDAPEFRSTAPIACSRCRAEMDAEEDDFHKAFNEIVCGGCVDACEMCGEWLDDSCFPWKLNAAGNRYIGGPITIRFRDWKMNGRLSRSHCPVCAANVLLEGFTGVSCMGLGFDMEDYSKEGIRLMLAANAALPGMVESEYLPEPALPRKELAHAV